MEISSFVAVPLAGMTLAALGADVVRVDPAGGAADAGRWPLTETGESIYWAGLNRGKRSMAVDMRSAEDRDLVVRLIAAAGVFITNAAGRPWHSYETLAERRADLIHLEVVGRADGTTAVDYTVNAATGFPLVTGPADHLGPVNHVMPAWDVSCGLYAALAVLAALRRRDATGLGVPFGCPSTMSLSRPRPTSVSSPRYWSAVGNGPAWVTRYSASTARISPAATGTGSWWWP